MSEMIHSLPASNKSSQLQSYSGGTRVPSKLDTSFYDSLQQSLASEDSMEIASEVQKVESIEQSFSSLEDFIESIQKETNTFLNTDMLDDLDIQQLLALLPGELVEEVKNLFYEGIPLELLLGTPSEEPKHIMALVIVATYYKKYADKETLGTLQRLLQNVEKSAHNTFSQDAKSFNGKAWSEFVDKISAPPIQVEENNKTANLRGGFQLVNERLDTKQLALNVYSQSNQTKDTPKPIINLDVSNSHMSRIQQLFLHNGDKQGEKLSEQQFVRQFQQTLGRSQFQNLGNGIQQLSLKLHPQSLGRLDITLQQINGVMVAKIMTTTSMAKELIESQLHQLRNAFHGQQIQVERIEITQQQNTHQQTLRDQQQSNSQSNKEEPSSQPQQDDELDEEGLFSAFLEETINMEV